MLRRKTLLSRLIDRIFMGVIVGGAIGSVIGMAVAPKKGKETRKIIKKFVQEHSEIRNVALKTSRSIFDIFRKKPSPPNEKVQRIPYEGVERVGEVKK